MCMRMRVRAEGPQGIDIATDIYEHVTAPMRAFSQTPNSAITKAFNFIRCKNMY